MSKTIGAAIFACIGFLVSWYIYTKKRRGEKLVCFIGEDCNRVVRSPYNKLLGFPNEMLGIGYYGFVLGVLLLMVVGIEVIGPLPLALALLGIEGIAAAFSVLLLVIQAVVLREWCEYCLVSAGTSIGIFLLGVL